MKKRVKLVTVATATLATLAATNMVSTSSVKAETIESKVENTEKITTKDKIANKNNDSIKDEEDLENNDVTYRVRKLTPTECYKLMGFEKEDVEKAREVGASNSALYEQAGNSIITNCVALLAEHLYKAQYDENYVCTDENFTQPQQ